MLKLKKKKIIQAALLSSSSSYSSNHLRYIFEPNSKNRLYSDRERNVPNKIIMLRFTPFPTCLNLHSGTDGLTLQGFMTFKMFNAFYLVTNRLGRCVITIVSKKSMASNLFSESLSGSSPLCAITISNIKML
jgi:hypothetical protein